MNWPADFAGRYGAFVWPAYAFTALGFAWMTADTLWRARRWRGEARALEKARPKETADKRVGAVTVNS